MDERTKRLLGVAALVGMFATATARAIDVRGADDSASDAEAAVRAASQAYVEALARGDAEAIAAMWTADGVYVDAAGQEFVARELAHREFDRGEAAEKHPLAKPAAVKSTIRLLDDNVALEEGTADTEELAGGGQPAVQFSAVWVREGNDWRLDHLREHVVEATPKKSPLDELSWFVGNWVAHGADVDAELSVRWSDDRHFLLQHFTVRRAGHNAIGAEQRIGWDPADE
ncbi:MAG: nuclear transport factor 2 family protein, partial [Planctomycetales bacterium]|nr:nuclear transport factor 2 family protein [Planctomycetales bacterium]